MIPKDKPWERLADGKPRASGDDPKDEVPFGDRYL